MTSRISTRTRFVIASLLLLTPLVLTAIVLLGESFNRSQQQIVMTEFATADVVAQSVAELVAGQQQGLQVLAEQDAIRAIDQRLEEAQALMDDYRLSRSAINGLFLLSENSEVVTRTGGIDVAGLPESFQSAAEAALVGGQATVSDSILLSGGEVEVVAIIVPVYANTDTTLNSADGTPVATSEANTQTPSGALGAFFSVERLIAGYQPATGFAIGSNIAVALVSSSGKVMTVPGGTNDPGQIFMDGQTLDSAISSALSGHRTRFTFTDPEGVSRATVAVPIPLAGNDWAVLVSVPEVTSYGPTRSLIDRAVVGLIGGVLLALALSIVLASWLTRPFRRLTAQAETLTAGGVVTIFETEAPSDAAELGRAIREMSDRLHAQVRDTESAREEIARQAERLRDLLRRTVRLQEDERRRIASDIHDAVSPLITGALYQAQAIRISKSNGHQNGHENGGQATNEDVQGLQEVSELLERAMRELHDVIFDLRPPDLDDIGIVAALQRHVDQVNRSGLLCTLEVIGEERRLPPEVRLAIYRIAQEALHNAMRHARADESVVRIEWLPDRLRVTIQDDGSGFDPDKDGRRAGLGLMSMRERAASIGASLEIVSREGSGTAIVVERISDDFDLTSDPVTSEVGLEEPVLALDEVSDGTEGESDEER